MPQHISKEFLETVLTNYLEESNTDPNINLTGSPLSQKKLRKFIHYMDLCSHIYTDNFTRTFISQQHSKSIEEKWSEIIRHKKQVKKLYKTLSNIYEQKDSITVQPLTFEKKTKKQNEQVPSISREALIPNLEDHFTACIEETNLLLQSIRRNTIPYKELVNISLAICELDKVKQNIDSDYSLYFSEKIEDTIPKFKDNDGEELQLTNKAIVADSFLHKTQLSQNNNITILDVGFRNFQICDSYFTNILSKIAEYKNNPTSWFEKWGEVDYVAYLEKDITQKRKDKLFQVYSGSNGKRDWITNLSIGHTELLGLSVHEGIGIMFRESTPYYHSQLIDRIKHYYNNHDKPKKFEIITMGHSLGGGLASLAAYYYKTKQLDNFGEITGLNKNEISVKTFLFGSPAIVDKPSKQIIESALGKKNISRVWTFDDPVVNWTDNACFQRGTHIGTSFPLYNIENLSTNMIDLWGPHGTERYKSYLQALSQENPSPYHKKLTLSLNNHIKAAGWDTEKKIKNKNKNI